MSFTSIDFIFFLAVTAILYYVVPHKLQNILLLVASYVFYMWSAPQQVYTILIATLVTYAGTLLMARKQGTGRKVVVACIAVLNLGTLFMAKYFNFFAELFSPQKDVALSIVAVTGLSFFTFQLVGYCIDVYREKIEPERKYIDFALFISFFPQILSGPIGRGGELLPQYKQRRVAKYENLRDGSLRFLLGVFRKVVVADGLARYVDAVYANLGESDTLIILIVVVFYSLQIYFDFSGYTDMATGLAQILGINLRENFFVPYATHSPAEFWSRWHMSLSTWFRDYLYIPLGGNRKGFARRLFNVAVVFVVSGLWHGAKTTFILWGVWHALFRLGEDVVLKLQNKKRFEFKTKLSAFIGIVITDIIVFFGWVLFRADYAHTLPTIVKKLFTVRPLSFTINWIYGVMAQGYSGSTRYAKLTLALLVVSVLAAFLLDYLMLKKTKDGVRCYNPVAALKLPHRIALCIFMALMILIIGQFGSVSFIYNNF